MFHSDCPAPLSPEAARSLARPDPTELPGLMKAAARRRDQAWGRRITFSPKVFLPLTNLCRNFCDYCTFRRSPKDDGVWTMDPGEVRSWLERARVQGCVEALFCLGDTPESVFPSYKKQLAGWGFDSTVAYIEWACILAIELGLLPHTNAGILSAAEMERLKPVNVSLGLMLENASPRLCEKGMPHHRAPDKLPERRIAMTREAGELSIAFTSGLLIGIGESWQERVDTLLAIRELHRQGGHIQEVIVQNFRAKPGIPMAGAPEPADYEVAHAIALARLILPDEVSVQSPPNLNPATTSLLIEAGINDFGGISPVSPDYVNPGHPWPQLARLAAACSQAGYELAPRLPIYDRYAERPGFVAEPLRGPMAAARARMHEVMR